MLAAQGETLSTNEMEEISKTLATPVPSLPAPIVLDVQPRYAPCLL